MWKMVEILNLFVLGPLCVRFLCALFKKVWLGGRKKGCQVVCSCCGWAQQSLLETGKKYPENKWVCSARKKISSADKKPKRCSKGVFSNLREGFKKEMQQISEAIKDEMQKAQRKSTCTGRGIKKEGSWGWILTSLPSCPTQFFVCFFFLFMWYSLICVIFYRKTDIQLGNLLTGNIMETEGKREFHLKAMAGSGANTCALLIDHVLYN